MNRNTLIGGGIAFVVAAVLVVALAAGITTGNHAYRHYQAPGERADPPELGTPVPRTGDSPSGQQPQSAPRK